MKATNVCVCGGLKSDCWVTAEFLAHGESSSAAPDLQRDHRWLPSWQSFSSELWSSRKHGHWFICKWTLVQFVSSGPCSSPDQTPPTPVRKRLQRPTLQRFSCRSAVPSEPLILNSCWLWPPGPDGRARRSGWGSPSFTARRFSGPFRLWRFKKVRVFACV